MEEKLSAALTLYNELKNLCSNVEKLPPDSSRIESGVNSYIPLFNSMLERTREFLSSDPKDSLKLGAIAAIEPVRKRPRPTGLQLASNQQTKQQILAGAGSLLAALEGYRQSATEESTPVTQTKEFTFVNSPELRKILERDYIEIQRAFIAHCWKSVIILSGGTIEAILMDLLLQKQSAALAATKAPKGKSDISRWDLADLINVSVELRLVTNGVERLSHPVRDYRNLVHPGNEVRNNLTFGAEEAKIALEVLHIVHRDCS